MLLWGDNPRALLSWLVAVTFHITIHEFAHAKRAQMAGDPTPELNGRVSLNPLAHYDLIGTTALLLLGIGWGKPVPVNSYNFRRPRHDDIMVSAWGGFANLIGAAVVGLAFRVLLHQGVGEAYYILFAMCVRCGLVLAFFNYIPVYPLDGSHILLGFLPTDKAMRLEMWFHRFGMILLLVLIMPVWRGGSIIWLIIGYPIEFFYRLLIGVPYFFL